MTKEYMLKRLVTMYNRLGVEVAVNDFGVVRLRHRLIKDDCYYSSVTNCYEIMFGITKNDPDKTGSVFYVCNPDGSITPEMQF